MFDDDGVRGDSALDKASLVDPDASGTFEIPDSLAIYDKFIGLDRVRELHTAFFFDDHRFRLHLTAEPPGIDEVHHGLAYQSSAHPAGDEGFVADGESTADVSRRGNDQIASRIDRPGHA